MKPIDFRDVAKLINNSRVTQINLNPISEVSGKWSLYSGSNIVPHFQYGFYVIHLYSESTIDSIYSASRALRDPRTTQVVFAPSISQRLRDEVDKVFKDVAGIRSTSDYLFSFVQDQIRSYTEKIAALEPRYYVEAPYETPSGFKKKIPNPLLAFLSDTHPDIKQEGALSILLAEPGQGKTYTTQYLASNLCKQKKLPIYIHSPQWIHLTPGDLASVWKTIAHSFSYFESPIDWIQGCEEEFIRVALKAGIFRIIFDGFDEYILWNKGNVDPNETLENLLQLVDVTGAKILLTSRTSFWSSEVEDELVQKLNNSIYKIIPFDENSSKNYFNKRFRDSKKTDAAVKVFIELKKSSSLAEGDPGNFAGRGFILSLIADLVDRKEPIPAFAGGTSVMRWVMLNLCEREVLRQKLPLSAEKQIELFRECAELMARGRTVTSEILFDVLSATTEGLEESTLVRLIDGSLKDHPLVRKEGSAWVFVHDQILYSLLADQVIYYAEHTIELLKSFFDGLSVKGSLLVDLAQAIVDRIVNDSRADEDVVRKTRTLIGALLACCNGSQSTPTVENNEKLLATVIAMFILDKKMPRGRERKERTQAFVSYLPKRSIENLYFIGTIASMNFCDMSFNKCHFDKVTWASCKFNEKTSFNECHFIGGRIVNCEDFGLAQIQNCIMKDSEAAAIIEYYRIEAGKRVYSREDLKRDIEYIIRKFVPKDGVGIRSVYEQHIKSGPVGMLRHIDIMIEALNKKIIEKHEISSVSGRGYHIREEARDAVYQLISNATLTGPLREAFEEVCKKLGI